MNKNNSQSNTSKYQSGFTLIEMLIVVALIGILSALAYPSYKNNVQNTRRSDAHLSLLNAAQALERCKATQYSYANCAASVSATTSQDYYTVSLDPAPTASSYTILATAKGPQVHDTDCQEIFLDQLGQQTPAVCWD